MDDNNNTVKLSTKAFETKRMIDARQRNGELAPVFPGLLSDTSKYAREEAYIVRMIARDRLLG